MTKVDCISLDVLRTVMFYEMALLREIILWSPYDKEAIQRQRNRYDDVKREYEKCYNHINK